MSQSTPSGRRDAHRLLQDETEVRDALLERTGAIPVDQTEDVTRIE